MKLFLNVIFLSIVLTVPARSGDCESDSLSSCMGEVKKAAKEIAKIQEYDDYVERVERAAKAVENCLSCNSEAFDNMMQNFGTSFQNYREGSNGYRSPPIRRTAPNSGYSSGPINR